MQLCDGMLNHTYLIKKISLDDKLKMHLATIGIYNGALIKVWQKKHSGTMIIKVSGARWAVGHTITFNVGVQEVIDDE